MLKNKSKNDRIRGFYHLKESWYADANLNHRTDGLVDEVLIGFYGHDGEGGTTGEFAVTWQDLSGKLTPRLQVYDDAWEALTHFSDLLAEMAKHNAGHNQIGISPKEFCELLTRLGIKDLTKRKNPYAVEVTR